MTDMSTMPLSEALRLGSMATQQVYGTDFVCGPGGQIIGTCAVGAIRLALGCLNLTKSVPALTAPTYANCPACSTPFIGTTMVYVLAHLNDDHRWTRVQIADWLEHREARNTERAEERPTVLEKGSV